MRDVVTHALHRTCLQGSNFHITVEPICVRIIRILHDSPHWACRYAFWIFDQAHGVPKSLSIRASPLQAIIIAPPLQSSRCRAPQGSQTFAAFLRCFAGIICASPVGAAVEASEHLLRPRADLLAIINAALVYRNPRLVVAALSRSRTSVLT